MLNNHNKIFSKITKINKPKSASKCYSNTFFQQKLSHQIHLKTKPKILFAFRAKMRVKLNKHEVSKAHVVPLRHY